MEEFLNRAGARIVNPEELKIKCPARITISGPSQENDHIAINNK
jgi:hypothetical protein